MEEGKRKIDKISMIVMIVLIVLLLPVLIVNLTLIVKGSIHPDTPPAKGSLIFVKLLDENEKQTLEEGDVITFRSSGAFVTHRIVSVFRDESGKIVSLVTQGDANNTTDGAIELENVVGKCVGSVGGLGDFAMFMNTPVGILVFVGIPVLLYIA